LRRGTEPQRRGLVIGDRWKLGDEIGRGGTAVVYRAIDTKAGTIGAVKLLASRYAARADLRHRFNVEARAMASIPHEGVLRVFDWGVGEHGPYLVTEVAEGGSVSSWVNRHGAMPPALAVDVILQVCAAVEAAHDLAIVHRDLKPDNVLVTSDGRCRVCDFGIAQVHRDAERITRTGTTIGTLGFIAPEQIEDARNVDVRADVYAIATTLWFLIRARIPPHAFHTDPWEHGIPGVLCPIIGRATAFKREERHASVAELRAEFTAVLPRLPALPAATPPLFAPAEHTMPLMPQAGADDPNEAAWLEDDT
jgi:serine/threonine-protein kinase